MLALTIIVLEEHMTAVVDSKLCHMCSRVKHLQDFHKNSARRDGVSVYCASCMRSFCKSRAYDKNRWSENRDVEYARNKKYREENKERIDVYQRAKAAKFRAENPGVVRARNALRKKHIAVATPPWANLAAIESVYVESRRLERIDGIKRHVDHVIPLRGRLVSGLHVAENLRIVTAKENLRKKNCFSIQ